MDAAIDAIGSEAKGSAFKTRMTGLKLEGSNGQALRQYIAAVRPGGTVSVPGVYAGLMRGFCPGLRSRRSCYCYSKVTSSRLDLKNRSEKATE